MSFISPFADTDFPVSITHAYRISTKSRVIYSSVLLALIFALISLPFITIPVSVKGTGVLQAEIERYDLVIPVSGRIVKVLVKDNQKIRKGDTVLLMDASVAVEQASSLGEREIELKRSVDDLNDLLKYSGRFEIVDPEISLKTGQYNASFRQFSQELREAGNAKEQNERIFNRYNYLHKSNVVTLAEVEKFKFEYDQSISEYQYLIKRYRLQWQADIITCREELRQLKTKRSEWEQQQDLYTIISPCTGSIQDLKSLESGGYAFAGKKIAEVSPDGELRAYCYVKPSDIGQINVGQHVSFQVDAFNYTKWGLLTGKVFDISDDIFLLNNEFPVFKVKCTLERDYFALANKKTYLKKGMNLTARFNTGEYSLFQLLRNNAEDLIDPDANKQN